MASGFSQLQEIVAGGDGLDVDRRWARTQIFGLLVTFAWIVVVVGLFFVISYNRPAPVGVETLIAAALLLTLPVAMIWLYLLLLRQSQLTEMALFHQIADLEQVQILPQTAEVQMSAITEAFRAEALDFNRQARQALETFSALATSFEEQSRRMSTLATQVDKQSKQVKVSLQTQADQIIENMDGVTELQSQVRSTVDMVRSLREETATHVVEPMVDVQTSLSKTTSRAHGLVDALRDHIRGIERAYEAAETVAKGGTKTFVAEAQLLEDVAKSSAEQLEVLSTVLGPQIERLSAVQTNATQQADRIVDQVDTQIHRMDKVGMDLKSQADTLTDAVRDQVNHLDYLMKAVDDYGATISHQFEKQVDDVLKAADKASKSLVARTEEASGSMQVNLDAHAGQLERISKSLDTQVAEACTLVEQRIRQSIGEMDSMQDRVEAVIKTANNEITLLVSGFAKDLSLAGQDAMEDLLRTSQDLPTLAEQMAEAAQDAVARIEGANKGLMGQCEQVTGVASHVLSYGDQIRENLLSLPQGLEVAFLSVDAKYATLSQDLRTMTQELSESALESKTAFSALRADMEVQLGDVAQSMRKLNQDSRDLHLAFNDNVRALEGTTGKAKGILDTALERLHDEAASAVTTTKSFVEEVRELSQSAKTDIERLSASSTAALGAVRANSAEVGEQLRDFETRAARLQGLIGELGASTGATPAGDQGQGRESFLKASGDLVRTLQASAIDVETILAGAVPQDVLDAFQSGDSAVAVRRLLRRSTPLGATKVSEQYRDDLAFRAKVDTYVTTFEDLLAQAQGVDGSKLLHTTFLTSDLGKLYVFLTHSLGAVKKQ